jgi:catechol 2,3-dioxygenase-like lactoylglutathione lyase family enzyme
VLLILAPATVLAQAFPPNEAGVTSGHWHLNTRDVDASRKVFVAIGGTALKAGDFEVVRFPGVTVYLHVRQPVPPTGGTVGSVVNHVSFSVPNVLEAMARWKAAGAPVLPGNNGRTDQAFVEGPDGLRIEILEDKAQKFPIRSNHVHLYGAAISIAEIQAWYSKVFGARIGMRGRFQSVDLPGMNISLSESDKPLPTTKGRVLDHIGFDVTNLAAFMKKLEAAGVKIDRPFTPNPAGGGLAFIYDPWGTYIELNERPNPQYLATD